MRAKDTISSTTPMSNGDETSKDQKTTEETDRAEPEITAEELDKRFAAIKE